MTEFKQTAVIGAGVIGASWTALFVAAGMNVNIYDPSPTAELARIIHQAYPVLIKRTRSAGFTAWCDWNFDYALGGFLGFGRRLMPRWSRALRFDAAHQHDKHFALWAGCWKCNLDPRFQLLDTHRNFQECSSDGLEGGGSELRAFWGSPAQ